MAIILKSENINIDDFVGDDEINWSAHANEQITKGGIFENKYEFDYFSFLLFPNAKCLDIGCNIGRWAMVFIKNGWQYTGIDASYSSLHHAKQTYDTLYQYTDSEEIPYIEFIHTKAEQMDIALVDRKFDLIFTNSVLQHIHNENKDIILRQIHTLLDKDGYLVLQECIDETNCRAFARRGWVDYIEPFGFKCLIETSDTDKRNGFVFRRIRLPKEEKGKNIIIPKKEY